MKKSDEKTIPQANIDITPEANRTLLESQIIVERFNEADEKVIYQPHCNPGHDSDGNDSDSDG